MDATMIIHVEICIFFDVLIKKIIHCIACTLHSGSSNYQNTSDIKPCNIYIYNNDTEDNTFCIHVFHNSFHESLYIHLFYFGI